MRGLSRRKVSVPDQMSLANLQFALLVHPGSAAKECAAAIDIRSIAVFYRNPQCAEVAMESLRGGPAVVITQTKSQIDVAGSHGFITDHTVFVAASMSRTVCFSSSMPVSATEDILNAPGSALTKSDAVITALSSATKSATCMCRGAICTHLKQSQLEQPQRFHMLGGAGTCGTLKILGMKHRKEGRQNCICSSQCQAMKCRTTQADGQEGKP